MIVTNHKFPKGLISENGMKGVIKLMPCKQNKYFIASKPSNPFILKYTMETGITNK